MDELIKKLTELRQKAADARAKLTKAVMADDKAGFEAADAEVKALEGSLGMVERAIELEKASAQVVQQDAELADVVVQRSTVPAQPKKPTEKGLTFARTVKSIMAMKGNLPSALEFLEKNYGPEGQEITKLFGTKSLVASTATAGGIFVPEQISADFIELLRTQSVIRRAGARPVPMPNGNLTIGGQTGGVAGGYIGETENIGVEEPTFGEMKLSARKLSVLIPISNDLLRFANPGVDQMVRDDLLRGFATHEDQAFLRSPGTAATPKGLRYQVAAGNIIAANATVNVNNITADLGRIMTKLLAANVTMNNPVWLMAPAVVNYLKNLRTTQENYAFPEVAASFNAGNGGPNFMLNGVPGFMTNNIPTNLGGGGDETEVYLVEASEMIIGESMGLVIDTSESASFTQNGTTYSAYQRDMTLMRGITQHDFGIRHAVSGAVLTGVKWFTA